MILFNENKEICSNCKNPCCKHMSCPLFPQDLEIIDRDSLKQKVKEGFCFDFWEGGIAGKKGYFMRPKHKGREDRIVDPSWGGECIFLTDTGCKLSWDERPSGGKAPIPALICVESVKGFGKRDCADAWILYNDLIDNVINDLELEKKEAEK